MMAVRFKFGYSPYNAGEIAGFPPEVAKRLIQAGVAEEITPEKKDIDVPPVDKMMKGAPRKK